MILLLGLMACGGWQDPLLVDDHKLSLSDGDCGVDVGEMNVTGMAMFPVGDDSGDFSLSMTVDGVQYDWEDCNRSRVTTADSIYCERIVEEYDGSVAVVRAVSGFFERDVLSYVLTRVLVCFDEENGCEDVVPGLGEQCNFSATGLATYEE